jgi:hypothetical protein
MKKALEENIKSQLTRFMEETGIGTLQLEGCLTTKKRIANNDAVETEHDTYFKMYINNFLND